MCCLAGVEMIEDLVLQSRISARQVPAVAELMESGSLTFLKVRHGTALDRPSFYILASLRICCRVRSNAINRAP